MRRVTDDDERRPVPYRHGRQVVRVVSGELKNAVGDQLGRRPAIVREEPGEPLLPTLGRRRLALGPARRVARHVGKPDRSSEGIRNVPKNARAPKIMCQAPASPMAFPGV